MKTFVRDYDWEQVFHNTNVNTKSDHFKAVVNSAVQRFVHISTKKRNRKPRWMSKTAELARRKKIPHVEEIQGNQRVPSI